MTFLEYDMIPRNRNVALLAAMKDYKVCQTWWPNVMYFAWEKSDEPHLKRVYILFQKEPSVYRCFLNALNPKTVCVAYDYELLSGTAWQQT